MDILIEIILDVYLELMMLIAPEKGVTKKQRIIAKTLAIAVLIVTLFLIVFGAVLIWENNNLLGIIPFSFGIIISLAQIILGVVLYNKNH